MADILDELWQRSYFVDSRDYDGMGAAWKAEMDAREQKIIRGSGRVGTSGCNPVAMIEGAGIEVRDHIVACHNACRDLTAEGLESAARHGVVDLLYGPQSSLRLTIKNACRDVGCEYSETLHPADLVTRIMRAVDDAEELRKRFNRLAAQWTAETGYLSSTTKMAEHPAYQEIIGFGLDVVPLILEELELRSGHWFLALRSITEVDPVPECDRGNVEKMREAWLEWGKNRSN